MQAGELRLARGCDGDGQAWLACMPREHCGADLGELGCPVPLRQGHATLPLGIACLAAALEALNCAIASGDTPPGLFRVQAQPYDLQFPPFQDVPTTSSSSSQFTRET